MNNNLKVFHQENIYCQYDSQLIHSFEQEMLEADFWQHRHSITGSAQGRGTTWFIKTHHEITKAEQHWVLRHYYRGGLVGKLINDSYLFTSMKKTRAAKEFALLSYMQSLQLPAPQPVAYRIIHSGLFYQADLLSSRINNAEDLVAILSKKSISTSLWQDIGATIKRFHNAHVYHHDLNAHNILIDDKQQVFIIDFDRCEIRENKQHQWQPANLARLQRSFMKELGQLTDFHFNQENWKELLSGYLSFE